MNEFGIAIADMLYSRVDGGEFLQRLQDSPAYAQAQQEYHAAYKALAGDQGLAPGSQEQTLIDALRHVHDLELQYKHLCSRVQQAKPRNVANLP